MSGLIFALGEDGVLYLFNDMEEVRQSCEGIDVENEVWQFFDAAGRPLRPVFHTPNQVSEHFFGLFASVRSSQDFDFLPAGVGGPTLPELLSEDIYLDPNDHFDDIDAVMAYFRRAG